jgi:ectoine hydroxylase-related dioxygenase (phytanoyl-CoA dioxygenase family)
MAASGRKPSEEHLDFFQRQGYVVLRGFFASRSVQSVQEISENMSASAAAILAECNRHGQSPAERAFQHLDELIVVPEASDPSKVCRYEYMIGSSPAFRDFTERLIGPMIGLLLNEPVVPFKDKTNEKLPGGGGFGPHQDFVAYQHFGPRYNATALITINAATQQNGCLQFAQNFPELIANEPDFVKSIADGRPILNHEEGGENHGDLEEDIAKRVVWSVVETDPSDLVVFDSFIPHRSEPNMSETQRRAIFVTFNRLREGRWYDRYYAEKRSRYHDPKFHVSTPTRHEKDERRVVLDGSRSRSPGRT